MRTESIEVKKGITLHQIKTNKFKTDLIAIFISIPLKKETVTMDCIIPAVLRRGTKNLKTQEDINKKLDMMYGATFDCGIEKIGDNHVIKFYIEYINDLFLPTNENKLEEKINLILDIVFNPLLENDVFVDKYVQSEKENIRKKIRAKIDNREQYAQEKCIQEMYADEPYGLYKYGQEEDLDKITSKELYEYYIKLVNDAKIDIFVSGDVDEEKVTDLVTNNLCLKKLNAREPQYIINNEQTEKKKEVKEKRKEEILDIIQGKLILGLDILENKKDMRFAASIYNIILGESATSKLFQNVREKASLAYSARSSYIRQKNNIFIKCGIEIKNYEKALNIIYKQLDDMKQGNFTDEDIENAKKYMINGINSVEEEQDTQITYYMGQELSGLNTSLEEYKNKIQELTKKEIVDIANKIQINTVYFLKNSD